MSLTPIYDNDTHTQLVKARTAHAEAARAAEIAVEAADELRTRLRAGDTRVTATLLTKADAEVERTSLLLTAAEATSAKIIRTAPKALDYAEALGAALRAGGLPVEVRRNRPDADEPQTPHLVVTPSSHAHRDIRTGRIYGEAEVHWIKGPFGANLDIRQIQEALDAAGVQMSGPLHLRTTLVGQDVRIGREPGRWGRTEWGAWPAEIVLDSSTLASGPRTTDAVLGQLLRRGNSTLTMSDHGHGLVSVPAIRRYREDGTLQERTVDGGRIRSRVSITALFGPGDAAIEHRQLDTALPARAGALVGCPVEGAGRIVNVTDVHVRPIDADGSQRGWLIPSGSIPTVGRTYVQDRAPRELTMTVEIEALAA